MADEYDDENDLEVILERGGSPGETGETGEAEAGEAPATEEGEPNRRVVKPKVRVTRPQLKLDAVRLTGPRGLGALEPTFSQIKLEGKGHELEDLKRVMRALEHWALRLFPKMAFDDIIDKIEDLGLKKNVMNHVARVRLGMEEEAARAEETEPTEDPFDSLLPPEPPSSPGPPPLTEEQKARMLRNRLVAEEIRMKKMKAREEARRAQELAAQELLNSDQLEDFFQAEPPSLQQDSWSQNKSSDVTAQVGEPNACTPSSPANASPPVEKSPETNSVLSSEISEQPMETD